MEETRKFKDSLTREEEKLKKRLSKLEERRDFGDDTDSLEEESDETEEFGNILGIKKVLESKLQRVTKALQKMEENNYGTCEKCGGEIEKEILEAEPESLYCKECKKSESVS